MSIIFLALSGFCLISVLIWWANSSSNMTAALTFREFDFWESLVVWIYHVLAVYFLIVVIYQGASS